MRNLGFSTGAIALGDFRLALRSLVPFHLKSIELSALRLQEIDPLLDAIPSLDLSQYEYISIHAPSSFSPEQEIWLSRRLHYSVPEAWRIVIHPDSIIDFNNWKCFGPRIAIENMDRRKGIGRTARELSAIMSELPQASLCFDIGHACQFDPSMTEAFLILTAFRHKLVQVHLSEVNSRSQHERVSYTSQLAFSQVASLIPDSTPVIVESRVDLTQIGSEIGNARRVLPDIGTVSFDS